jgi:CHASE2 domain-containing sensor protein
MMILVGVFHVIDGLVALLDNGFYVVTRAYTFQFDTTSWGWIHLILGVVIGFAGWGLLSGRTWARAVAITLAGLSIIANFLFIPYYPFWSITAIIIGVFVIWAVATHGRELRDASV